jgi:hypothetical protein
LFQQLDEQLGLSLPRNRVDGVRNSAHCLGATSDLHNHRLAQVRSGERLHFRRHRRAEEESLPVGWDLAHDPIELRREPHVEHAVRFIEDQDFEVVE